MKSTKLLACLGLIVGTLNVLTPPAHANSPRMIGANIAGGEFGGSGAYPGVMGYDYWYPRQSEIDMAKAIGIELIRVPFTWDRIQHDVEGVLDATLWAPDIAALDASIAAMEARGMRVILDMHNYHKRALTVGGVRTGHVIGSPQLPVSEFARVWRLLADHYKNRPSIWGYDLMNEPIGVTTADLVNHYQAAVNAIREVDMKTAIILEGGPNWNHASSWLTTGAPLLAVVDPANNLIFSAHCYTDRDQSGTWSHGVTVAAELVGTGRPYATLDAALNVGVDRVKPFVDWCVANNVRGLVGEYASPYKTDEANWNIVLDRMLGYMVNNGAGLISGTQWSHGGITLSSETRMLPRVDNSMPSQQESILPNYFSGVGTNYWQTFFWYSDTIATTADYSFPYVYPTQNVTINAADTSGPQSGTKAIKVTYTLPAGVSGGGGLHTRGPLAVGALGGVDIRRSVQAGHVLSFYAKGTPGASVSVTLGKTSNASGVDAGSDTGTGNWISLSSIAALTSNWQLYQIPLSSIINSQVTGNERVQRFRFTVGPSDGVSRELFFDRITIGLATTNTAPVVTVNTSTGGSEFLVERSVPLVATATDADAGDGIDYVEFYSNHAKIGIDDIAPYEWTTSFAETGTYNITAIAFDLHGVATQSAAKTVTILPNAAPDAPTDLIAIAGRKEVSLSWASSPGATSYRVKRSTADGGPYALIASSATPSYLDTGLQNNHTYYYVVTAVNAVGESANSAQASATPSNHPVPIPPRGLTATAGNTRILLTWAESPGATSYIVKLNRKEVNENSGVSEQGNNGNAYGHYTIVATVTTNSYIATGLANDQLYRYVVSAVNDAGESRHSDEVGATPFAAAEPAVPVSFTAVAGNAQVALSWADASGATSFNVKRATVSGGPYTTVASATTTSYTDTSVTNGTTYYYVVSGVKSVWESANSAEASARPMMPVPAAPTGLTATLGDQQVVLSWTAAATATSYRVKRATVAGGPYTTVGSPTATTYTNTGLTNGTTYYYVVSAVNAGGEGPDSAEASATPRQPVIIIKDNADSTGITITGSWSASTFNSGYYGSNYLHDGRTGSTGGKSVKFTPTISTAGLYEVYVRWTAASSRATNVPIDVNHAGGKTTFSVNQEINNNTWVLLGTFEFSSGTTGNVTIRNDGANDFVIADAVRFILK